MNGHELRHVHVNTLALCISSCCVGAVLYTRRRLTSAKWSSEGFKVLHHQSHHEASRVRLDTARVLAVCICDV
jgi:hypothetical protein